MVRVAATLLSVIVAQLLLPTVAVPVFKIDLDLPAEERFVEVAKHYKEDIIAIKDMQDPLRHRTMGCTPGTPCKVMDEWIALAKGLYTADQLAEQRGIAKVMGYNESSESFKTMLLGNIAYELGTEAPKGQDCAPMCKGGTCEAMCASDCALEMGGKTCMKCAEEKQCTDCLNCHATNAGLATAKQCSGVLWAAKNGTVMHGRNLDVLMPYMMPDGQEKTLSDVTHDLVFYKNKKPLYRMTAWPGGVFMHTGMRYDGWSIEQNTRSGAKGNSMIANFNAVKSGGRAFGLELRRLMETIPDYKTAVKEIWKTDWAAPSYFVMSGPGAFEGGVLSVDRMGKHNADSAPKMQLDPETSNSKDDDNWHLLETNDDLNQIASDARRPLAEALMKGVTQDVVTQANLEAFMHTPLLFQTSTASTNIMCVKTGLYKTILPEEAPSPRDAIETTELGGGALKKNNEGNLKQRKFLFKGVASQVEDALKTRAASAKAHTADVKAHNSDQKAAKKKTEDLVKDLEKQKKQVAEQTAKAGCDALRPLFFLLIGVFVFGMSA